MDDAIYSLALSGAVPAILLAIGNVHTYREAASDIRRMRAEGCSREQISEHLDEIEGAPVATYVGAKLPRWIYNV